jgi:polysaccharide biosynthesis transport protein
MDFGYLLQILLRRKWLIVAAALVAAVAVFLLIGRRPERYKASIIVSTGIVNYKGLNSSGDDAFVQQFQIENAFSNLIEFAQSRSSLKILSLEMLRHDLTSEGSGSNEWPFRKPNLKLYGPDIQRESQQLLTYLSRIRLDSISDPAFSQETDYLIDRVARTYGYDHDALLGSLSVKRKGSTDYLTIEVTTENPRLSQYMANAYVNLFMSYYQNLSVREKRKNVLFYNQLAAEKKAVVDTIKNRRYAYLYQKGLPALGKQSEELVNQIADLELQKQRAEATRQASTEQVGRLQNYMEQRGTLDAGATRNRVVDKYNVADLSAQVRDLTEKSTRAGGKDPRVEAELAGARHALDLAIQSGAGNLGRNNRTDDARRTQEDLYKEKVQADMSRVEAEKSLAIIESEINQRTGKLSTYVANDEVATGLADDQLRAEEEFKKVNEELINAKLALANTENPLHVIENAQLPEWPEPNRQVLLSVFSAIVVGTMVVLGLFLMAYFDRSLQSPDVFARYTGGLPLLGSTPHVPVKNLDFDRIFSSNGDMPQFTQFRESLRKLRNRIMQDSGRVLLFVSTKPQQGKTLTSYALAHALAANHKRVLILDTNFKTPLPDALAQESQATTTALLRKIIRQNDLEHLFRPGDVSASGQQGLVAVVTHQGAHLSPAEMLPPDQFRQFLSELSDRFDYVFLEAAALNQYSDAQELIPFVDRVVAVFNAATALSNADQASIRFLRELDDKFAGAVLADVDTKNLEH